MKKSKLSIRKAFVLPLAIGCALTSFGQNTNYGVNSLLNNTTGQWNSAFGLNSMYSNTEGSFNSAFGDDALKSNTSGNYNTAVGTTALKYNIDGDNNSASGAYSLYRNTSGNSNTANGSYALYNNTTGDHNTAMGGDAMRLNVSGWQNTAIGSYSLKNNSSGITNTAVGAFSLYSNTTGLENTAIGSGAMKWNTTGRYNSAVGMNAMIANINGWDNAAFGKNALYSNTSYDDNAAFGASALQNVDGAQNTGIGAYAGYYITGFKFNTISIGYLASATSSNTAIIGNSNMTSIGGQVGWSTLSDGRFKENIENDVPGIEFIQKLRPVTYNYNLAAYNKHSGFNIETDTLMSENAKRDWLEQQAKSEAITYTGFIAQEVEEAANEMNYNFSGVVAPQNDTDHYAIRYAEFVVPLVKATQEQQEELETLKREIAELKQMIIDIATVNENTTQEIEKTTTSVNCYPNPSTGKIQLAIENTNQEAIQVSVFSSTGELIYDKTTIDRDSKMEIDLSNQPNGQYLIQTIMGEKYFQNKVIIQK